MKPVCFALLFVIFPSAFLNAKPFLTREAPSLGRLTFEAGISGSDRWDSFGTPKVKYETVTAPFYARLGLMNKLDIGFSLVYLSHRMIKNGVKYSGSATAVFSPELKWAFNEHLSLLGIFTLNKPERGDDSLPVGRGNDKELVACYSPGTSLPLHFNLGYVWRDNYTTKFGIRGGGTYSFEPGDVFEAKAALEIPLPLNFSILTETAYYYVGSQKIQGSPVSGSSGEAWDALGGINWDWKGWNIGVEAGVGLLDETHSSLDLLRGSGDSMIQFYTSYRLLPWWKKR